MKKFRSRTLTSASACSGAIPAGLLVGLIVGLGLGGCAIAEVTPEPSTAEVPVRLPNFRLAAKPATAIDSLTDEQVDDMIAVSGEIAQRAAMLDGWIYQIEDETGSLWVVSDRDAPEVGEFIWVEGAVRYEPIVVEGIDAGEFYIEEKVRKRAQEDSTNS